MFARKWARGPHKLSTFSLLGPLHYPWVLGREIWKNCYVLERNVLLGNSQFRVSEGIQKGCLYVATPSQSLCRKKLIKCPVPWASILDETSHQENGFQVESAPITSTPRPATFIWVHNHTAVQRIIKSLQSIFKKKIRYSVSGKLGKRVCDAWPTPLSRQAMVWFAPI